MFLFGKAEDPEARIVLLEEHMLATFAQHAFGDVELIRVSETAVIFRLVTYSRPVVIDLRIEGPFYVFYIILYGIYVSGGIGQGLGDVLFETH